MVLPDVMLQDLDAVCWAVMGWHSNAAVNVIKLHQSCRRVRTGVMQPGLDLPNVQGSHEFCYKPCMSMHAHPAFAGPDEAGPPPALSLWPCLQVLCP